MPTESESTVERGYVSAESKRRFTIVAGTLGAVFFLAQMVLPMAVMFLMMTPMMFAPEFPIVDTDGAALWRGELWFVERTVKVDWQDRGGPRTTQALSRASLADLTPGGPSQRLEVADQDSGVALLAGGDRLWVIAADAVGYHDGTSLTWFPGVPRPPRASKAFGFGGRPAVVSLGRAPRLAALSVEGGRAEWVSRDLALAVPAEAGSLRSLDAVEIDGRLTLFAQVCTDEPDHCSILARGLDETAWSPLVEEVCGCGRWSALALGSSPALVLSEQERGGRSSGIVLVTAGETGPTRTALDPGAGRLTSGWRPLAEDGRLFLVAQGMPGTLKLVEMEGGRVSRQVTRKGSSPFTFFGDRMVLLMTVPQALPAVLSLVLAFVLTAQMRRHRVPDYVWEGRRRTFASLWKRAVAQLVDLVPLVAGFVLATALTWRTLSDPEWILDAGPAFPLFFLGLFAGAFAWALAVLAAYSFFEGRSGKTPGKWLVGIRVLGTDLRPCGFGRALLRNLLTFVDGFFNFLVGALLVALTENWQRLGDFAARTIVVIDEPAPAGHAAEVV